jgi:hypothetical protein
MKKMPSFSGNDIILNYHYNDTIVLSFLLRQQQQP